MSKGLGTGTVRRTSLSPNCSHLYVCSSGGRLFRRLMSIHKQSADTASGVHSGKGEFRMGDGDQVILFGYAGDETGKTKVRILMIGLDEGGKTAILHELKHGEVVGRAVSTWRPSRKRKLEFHRVVG